MTDPLTVAQRAEIQSMLDTAIVPINERLDRGADKMRELSTDVSALRDEMKVNTDTTVEVRDLLDVGKGGLRVLGWIGAAARWVAAIGGGVLAISAVVHALKTGTPPHKP